MTVKKDKIPEASARFFLEIGLESPELPDFGEIHLIIHHKKCIGWDRIIDKVRVDK
jgi:hypothetical protein